MSEAKIVVSAVDQTRAAFDSARRNMTSLGDSAGGLVTKFGAIGLAISGAFAAVSFKGVIDTLDQLDDLSEKTGIGVESLSALRYAGEVTGTSLEQIAGSVKKLSKNMAEAAGGGKEAAASFDAVGVAVQNSDGALRSQDAVLADLATKFASYEDGAAKSALAQRIFGKSGEDMIPLLNLGADGLARLKKEAGDLGAIYGGDLAKSAALFNDNLKRLELNAEGAKVSILGGLLPALNKLIETFLRLKAEGSIGTIVKDAAKDIIGMGRLSGNAGNDLNTLRVDRDRALKDLAFAEKKGLPTRDIDSYLQKTQKLIEISKTRQLIQANSDNGDMSDAVSRRRVAGVTKTAAPIVPGGSGSGKSKGDGSAARKLEDERKLLAELAGLTGGFAAEWELLNDAYAKGKSSLQQLTEQQAILLGKQPAVRAAAEAEQKILDIRLKNQAAADKHIEQLGQDNEKQVENNARLAEANEAIGLNAAALNMLTLARMDANINREKQNLLDAQNIEGNEREIAQIERRIALLQGERELTEQGQKKQVDADEKDQNKKRAEGITESISDGLMNGFRNGKSFGDTFLNELKAQFAKTVLQPAIKPLVEAAFGGLFGGGSGGGLLGALGSLLSFDGGGSTGSGARAGGMDGKGGFVAMLHPNESVVDHTKGQSIGASISNQYVVNIDSRADQGAIYSGVQQMLAQNNREQNEQLRRAGVLA